MDTPKDRSAFRTPFRAGYYFTPNPSLLTPRGGQSSSFRSPITLLKTSS